MVEQHEWSSMRQVQKFWNSETEIRIAVSNGFPPKILPPLCDAEGCTRYAHGLFSTADGRAMAFCCGHMPQAKAAGA